VNGSRFGIWVGAGVGEGDGEGDGEEVGATVDTAGEAVEAVGDVDGWELVGLDVDGERVEAVGADVVGKLEGDRVGRPVGAAN